MFNLKLIAMKKVSKKVQSTKNEDKYVSLNGDMLKKIEGGTQSGSTDRLCSGGCGATAAFIR